MTAINTKEAPAAIGPYSQAIVTNGMVYTSGQIPLIPESGDLIKDDIQAETRQVIENLKAVLSAAGSDLEHVVKTTCFLTDMNDFIAFNEVYAGYFKTKPSRSCVAAAALPKGASVEIEAIAAVK